MALDAEARALLAPYVTSLDSPVFALRNLPEEVVAVLFAYYSRSSDDLRTNLLKLLREGDLEVGGHAAKDGAAEAEAELARAREKAREFHEKWVVGYGHASVAEHAVAHLAVEGVSILASKAIEDARLASYTEKSTRYVRFPREYYPAPELAGEAAERYHAAIGRLFDTYETLLPRLTAAVTEAAEAAGARSAFRTERGFLASCRAQACDALRGLLPAAARTHLGLTANARTLEHLLCKLLSHPLREVRETGERIQREAQKLIPTLIRYARPKPYLAETPPAMRRLAAELLPAEPAEPETRPSARLVEAPADAETRLAAAILYEFTGEPYERLRERVRALPEAARRRVLEEYLARRVTYGRPPHTYTDPPLRSLEHLYFTFDLLVDYGAYRDIQRHRMATQTAQRLTCAHGYDVPEWVERCGAREEFVAALETAAEAWARLAEEMPEEAQYVVPLAFRKRALFTWNLRELHHFISLRSARQGHPSYRRLAWEVYRELERAFPFLARFIQVDFEEYALARPEPKGGVPNG